ncbi:MAG TPA: hypothetical protein IAC03_05430 [Candidatus Coprenecus pullistercoris]|nr:hypothetical protein [Candidatus Coprenecus pullistercoris]
MRKEILVIYGWGVKFVKDLTCFNEDYEAVIENDSVMMEGRIWIRLR